jgi:choline dehydrogenase-like flavoprotein
VAKASVVIVGSGAGGSVAAWALTAAGHPVVILEKGRNLLPGIGTPAGPRSLFGNDDVKAGRSFENQDPLLEPRTGRTQLQASQGTERSFIGEINNLPTTVGGGTIHWDAKVPRFWRQDFKGLSTHGPIPGANVADWPLTYDDLAPFYDDIERVLGVQGDVAAMPASTLAQAPRGPFAMPPNPPMYAGRLLAQGAAALGYTAYPYPMAINSQPFDGRPACNSCGFCSGYGCPINARGGAPVFLHHALLAGAELRSRCFVHRVEMAPGGKRATGVSYLDAQGREQRVQADIVILAPSAIETARLGLLSATSDHPNGLGNRSGQLGRNLMFHFFTIAGGLFPESVHGWRGPNSTFTIDDFVGPDFGAAAKAAGLPYLKGGICETGGTLLLFDEAGLYSAAPNSWGLPFKQLMRQSPLRVHIAGLSMVGEDMPQEANRVDLDPSVKDVYGFPVPRVTRTAHLFELAAAEYYGPRLAAVCGAAPGALGASWIPIATVAEAPAGIGSAFAGPAGTQHLMGTARMGSDPATSVVDAFGRMHDVENVFVGDGSVFTSAGGFNPSLTIMALSLRMARHIAGAPTPSPAPASGATAGNRTAGLPPTGGSSPTAIIGAAAAAAGLAARRYSVQGEVGDRSR